MAAGAVLSVPDSGGISQIPGMVSRKARYSVAFTYQCTGRGRTMNATGTNPRTDTTPKRDRDAALAAIRQGADIYQQFLESIGVSQKEDEAAGASTTLLDELRDQALLDCFDDEGLKGSAH